MIIIKNLISKIILKIKNYHPSKKIMFLYLLIPLCFSFFSLKIIDNDFWFLINTGKYITNNGFPHIEPFTIHSNLFFVAQQWLTDIIFYMIYNPFGEIGIYIFMILIYLLIMFLIYKICLLVSDNKTSLSIIVTVFISLLLLLFGYIITRPQIFDFIILLLEIYILELYIRKKNTKILLILPILSILFINLHAATWFMMLLFMIPYLIDSLNIKVLFLKTENYNNKLLFLVFILMLLFSLINPYGIDAITYIINSFGDNTVNSVVMEMRKFYDWGLLPIITFIIISILVLVTYIRKYKIIKIRYLLLMLGTFILGLTSYKAFSFFIIGGLFSISYYYKDNFKNIDDCNYSNKFLIKYYIVVIYIILIPLLSSFRINFKYSVVENIDKIVECMKDKVNYDSKIYTDYNTGSYLEWNNYHVYLDPRAEVFLKKINKKENIIYEEYNLKKYTNVQLQEFIDKYDFDYLLLTDNNNLYDYVSNNKMYVNICKQENKKSYYLFHNIKK